jgi:glycosyltransferase involved in cell wall biosynthesis
MSATPTGRESAGAPTVARPDAGWRTRARARWHGFPREVPGLSEAVGLGLLARASAPGLDATARASILLSAARRLESAPARRALRRALERTGVLADGSAFRDRRVGWSHYEQPDSDMRTRELTTSLVLKEPGPGGEKGVLYCSFEYNLMRLLAHYDARRVLEDYFVVGATSWSPTDFVGPANFAGLSPDPLFLGVSNRADVEAYRLLAPVVEPVPLLASDWAHPGYYHPRPSAERDVDILMVANFLPFKRHWLLFEALRRMRRDLRVVLIGISAPGRGPDEIRAEARAFGAPQELEILTGVHNSVVGAHQERARVSLILSRREGSCVATAESLFAGCPVGMMADAHVGSKAYINPRTGVLLRRTGLAVALEAFLERSAEFEPRAWADEHISCWRSSAALNDQLRTHSERRGLPWTRDIVPLCWRHVPAYATDDGERAMAGAADRLRAEHGVVLRKHPVARPGAVERATLPATF